MVSLVTLALVAAAQLPPPPPSQVPLPPRDNVSAPRAPTGVIRGQVTARDTGQPIARAAVVLTSRALRRAPGEGPMQTRTDADGRYEFTGLPAAEYFVAVRPNEFRPVYLPQSFGEDRPAWPPPRRRPSRALVLVDGEVRDDVHIGLWRAYAIEGRVVDEFGEPMAGVRLQPRSTETGQPLPTAGPFMFSTDDRGAYRIYGVAPGSYVVCATPRQFGPSAADTHERYIETCHPAAVTEAEAQPVSVVAGDVAGVDIRLQRSRAFTVSGIGVNSSGAPLTRSEVNLVRIDRNGTFGTGLNIQPNGQFTARGLTPGDYVIRADTRPGPGPAASADPQREMAYVPFRVDDADIQGLVVVTRKPAVVSGRVVIDHDGIPPAPGRMRVSAMPGSEDRRAMMGRTPSAEVTPDLTFELGGLFAPAAVRLSGVPLDWVVDAIRYRSQDITDLLVDFTGAREGDRLEIVLTNRVAHISGTVYDASGGPAVAAPVVVLPANPATWDGPVQRSTATGEDGGFKLGPLRAGEYLIVALEPDAPQRTRPLRDYYERLAAIAGRLTLNKGEERVLQLHVLKLQ